MSITINNLVKKYNKQTALHHINVKINKGEIVGLLGPNGAGKSTLMKCICGVINFNEGTIEVEGLNIKKHELKIKSLIGFLPENNPLYMNMYIKEYLSFIANLHRINKGEIEKIIEKVGLFTEKNKKIKQLSKGYQQRVGLAQALLPNPKILMLDEPTNGLDPNQIIEIRQLISKLSKEKTIILSTHIMQEVEALCTRVILINQGGIIEDSPIQQFKGKFNSLEEAFFNYIHK